MTSERVAARKAFDRATDLVSRGRRSRKSTLRNDKYSCLLVCTCGRATLLNGELEFPIFGGLCEGCGRALPHVTVLTRQHAAELSELAQTLAGQSAAGGRGPQGATE